MRKLLRRGGRGGQCVGRGVLGRNEKGSTGWPKAAQGPTECAREGSKQSRCWAVLPRWRASPAVHPVKGCQAPTEAGT